MKEQAWLITFEWRSAGSSHWKNENARFIGCPGLWFEDYSRSSSEDHSTDTRFIGAVPISRAGFDALDGHDHGANGDNRPLVPREDEDE